MNNINKENKGINDSINNLTINDYLIIIKSHIRKILFFTIFGFLISLYIAITTPPEFKAIASIVIQDKPGAGMIMDLTGNRDRDRISNEIQIIKSRTVAKETIKKLWKDKKNGLFLFNTYPFIPKSDRVKDILSEIISLGLFSAENKYLVRYDNEYDDSIGERFADKLISSLDAKHRIGTNIIDISYKSVWASESKLVINTLIDVYKEFELELSGNYADKSVDFLKDLLSKQEVKLRTAENEFANFKNQEKMYDLDIVAGVITNQLSEIESEIYIAESEINIRRKKYNILKSKLSEDEKILAERLLNNINVQVLSLRNEIGLLESKLIQNVSQYGKEHGAVRELEFRLKRLQDQLNIKVKELTELGITVQDPLQSRQDIVMEMISIDSEIIGLELKINESKNLLIVYEEKLTLLPDKQLRFSRLQRNIRVLEENYSLIRQKLEEANINAAVQVGKVQVVDYARLPLSHNEINRIIILGIILGSIVGIGFAFSLEFFNNTVRSIDDVSQQNLVVLGIIPSIGEPEITKNRFSIFNRGKQSGGLKRRLMTKENPKSPVSESYRSLRTSLLYSSANNEPRSILVSSAGPGEGKTTTVANLAITYANLGKKTLLIDTDLRRPVVHNIFELNREDGITNYLASATNDYNQLIKKTTIENLNVITAGVIPPNPSELLGSSRMTDFIHKIEKEWDIVLFDSPPLVAVTDATMISKEIDMIVMVVKVGHTDKKAFEHTINNLRNVNAPLGGIILNAVTHKNSYGSYYYNYYYQYYNYYGSDSNSDDNK